MVLQVKVVQRSGKVRNWDPLNNFPKDLYQEYSEGNGSGTKLANELEKRGWKLVSAVPYTGGDIPMTELWFRKD